MVPNLSTAARTYSATSSSWVTSAVDRQRLRRGRQILDRGLQVLLLAVDRDDARAALGQQPHGRGADDAGSTGDDGDPAVQTNSIGHFRRFLWLVRLSPDFHGFRARDRAKPFESDYFICGAALTSGRGVAARPPFPRRIRRVNRWPRERRISFSTMSRARFAF